MTHEQLSFSRAVRFLLPCVAAFGWIDLGRAADVDLPPAVPPYVSGWSGCYIGGHAGYGTTTSDSVYSSPASPVLDVNGFFTAVQTLGKFDSRGFAGGGHVGCQQQSGAFVWGAEADWSSFRNSVSQNFTNSFDEGGGVIFSQNFNQTVNYTSLWSVRGRLGVVVSDVYHVYLTAGLGGAQANYAYAGFFREDGPGGCACGSIAGNVDLRLTGMVFGAGMEWKAWSNFIVGVEYLHYNLSADTVIAFNTAALNPLIALGDHVRTKNADVVRARASWLVNFWR